MSSISDPFGPGPVRITNEKLNEIQDLIDSKSQAAQTEMGPGQDEGGDSSGLESTPHVHVESGAGISNGTYYEFPATDLTLELQLQPGESEYVWVYVDGDGQVKADEQVTSTPTWPDPDLTVLGFGHIVEVVPGVPGDYKWDWYHDVRRFVRQSSNGAVLVVGDLNAGADFETIQQALDYLEARALGESDVLNFIVVTKNQQIDEAIQVRCHGVVIEGARNESQDEAEGVTISWSYGASPADVENAALINLNGFEDVTIRNIHLVHEQTDPWCYIHDPGSRFRLESCTFGNPTEDSRVSVVVNFPGGGSGTPEDINIVDNKAYRVIRGLIGHKGPNSGEGDFTPVGGIMRSYIARNLVSVVDVMDWQVDDASKMFYAIDLGIDPASCKYNVVQDNVVEGCFCGVRSGPFSRVRSNIILECLHTGILVTSNGEVPDPLVYNQDYALGYTEVCANHVELTWFNGAPWWRCGVRLEVSSCQVMNNSIVVASQGGCGIVHGPLDLSDRDIIGQHVAALKSGNHSVTGNSIVMNPVDEDGNVNAAKITRAGIGIALFSVKNRMTGNGVFHARTGILGVAYNEVSDNVITPSCVAILAWSMNTVTGNAIGWFPHSSPGIPWKLEEETPTGAVLLSNENTCTSNVIRCGMDDSGTTDPPAAVHVGDWPVRIFGQGWIQLFESTIWSIPPKDAPLANHLKGKRAGGNVIGASVIDLSNEEGAAGQASAIFNVNGICLEGQWTSGNPVNSVSSVLVLRGIRGVEVKTGSAVITGCSVYLAKEHCVLLDDAPLSKISGCILRTSMGRPVFVEQGSTDTTIDDCVIFQESLSAASGGITFTVQQPGAVVRADRVTLDACAVVSFNGPGILWYGSFGKCGSCWFYTRKPPVPPTEEEADWQYDDWNQTNKYATVDFFPAIRFGSTTDGAGTVPSTQGNIVSGAHMLNCSPLTIDKSHTPIEWSNAFHMYDPSSSYETDNPHPPEYSDSRWTNRVSPRTCYYRYDDGN